MSDFSTECQILRDEMVYMLASNDEQFAYVFSGALSRIDADEIIDLGFMDPSADPDTVVIKLRRLADAIEAGEIR